MPIGWRPFNGDRYATLHGEKTHPPGMVVPVEPHQPAVPLITNQMKAEHHGYHSFEVESACHECLHGLDDGEECSTCDGDGVYMMKMSVPWDTCKEIYKAMVKTACIANTATPQFAGLDLAAEAGLGSRMMVPVLPTESQWNGLARDLIMWMDLTQRPTGKSLYQHLEWAGREIPDWLRSEIPENDHVPPKGTRAAVIYRAMVEDYAKQQGAPCQSE